jgi:hypothetical protein
VSDDDAVSDNEIPAAPPPGLPGTEAQDLEDEVRRITARARHTHDLRTNTNDVILPFRVPRGDDPNIWCVRVKVTILYSAFS